MCACTCLSQAQYESDASGYFAQPCNAISNGFFLSMFKMPEMESKVACANPSICPSACIVYLDV